jgi:hypothetical protein
MRSKNTIEDELDAIRVAIYEETKDMTSEERLAYFRAQTDPLHKEYGIHTVHDVDLRASNRATTAHSVERP